MNEPRFAAELCALSIALIAAASPVDAATITVCPDGSCDFTSPVAAVNAAAAGDTIDIAAGTYFLTEPLSLYGKNLLIRGAINADGRPTTVLSGQNSTYHINGLALSSATVFENLALTNGVGPQASCIFMFSCAGTTFRNCSVRGNRAGAIDLNSSSVNMIGCEIVDNVAGPVTAVGGGLYVAGSISLVDCVVSGNAASFSGGGIFVPNGSTVNLTRTRVCGNTSPNGAQIGQNPGGVVNDLGGACVMSACGECPAEPCPADLDGDGAVGGEDLGRLLGAWQAAAGDLTGDGTTDGDDLGMLLAAWGPCP